VIAQFRKRPVATLLSVATTLLTILTVLAGTGVLSGRAAAIVAAAIALLNLILGVKTHGQVTPLAAPRDAGGRPLVPLERKP
jgi:hypothetical protein